MSPSCARVQHLINCGCDLLGCHQITGEEVGYGELFLCCLPFSHIQHLQNCQRHRSARSDSRVPRTASRLPTGASRPRTIRAWRKSVANEETERRSSPQRRFSLSAASSKCWRRKRELLAQFVLDLNAVKI